MSNFSVSRLAANKIRAIFQWVGINIYGKVSNTINSVGNWPSEGGTVEKLNQGIKFVPPKVGGVVLKVRARNWWQKSYCNQ